MRDDRITYVSWFSGIGGFELGLGMHGGFRCVAQSEVDRYASAVLRKRFPGTLNLGDITRLDSRFVPDAELWVGGWPCQPWSSANHGTRAEDHDAHLWPAFFRLVREKKPRFLLLENVEQIRSRHLADVAHDLASAGYVGSWASLRACDYGAPFAGRRVYIVAASHGEGESDESVNEKVGWLPTLGPSLREWGEPPEADAVDDGLPVTVARRLAGNAVVPQVVAAIADHLHPAIVASRTVGNPWATDRAQAD